MKPTTSPIDTITPCQAQEKLQAGAKILDVREYPEWANCHVPGSTLLSLSALKDQPERGLIAADILILCRSGQRAQKAAEILAQAQPDARLWVVDGGITAWEEAGFTTTRHAKAPLSLERQVRIGAGTLMLLGLFTPALRFLTYFVPCGLIFAGLTNWCGMAQLLAKAPWNRPQGNA